MMEIRNDKDCFVRLWRRLERTRRLLQGQYRRFCARHVLRVWFGLEATDDFIWEVCHRASSTLDDDLCGNDSLPPPSLYPRKHRELLRAIVATRLGIGVRQVSLKALDEAYSEVFPGSTPINIGKKRKLNEE